MADGDSDAPAPRSVHTYHCICTHLILASSVPLEGLSERSNTPDKARILRLASAVESATPASGEYGVMLGTALARTPIAVRGEYGFEKRYLQKCKRCDLTVGYQLDQSQYGEGQEKGRREDVVYLLPGGLTTTDDMAAGDDFDIALPGAT